MLNVVLLNLGENENKSENIKKGLTKCIKPVTIKFEITIPFLTIIYQAWFGNHKIILTDRRVDVNNYFMVYKKYSNPSKDKALNVINNDYKRDIIL